MVWSDSAGKTVRKAKAILILLRLPFLTVTFGGVALGTAWALFETGRFQPGLFLMTLLGAFAFHAASNAANDYFDFLKGTDALNRSGTRPFSGGSGVVLKGFVGPKEALAVSLSLAVLGSAAGLYLNSLSGGRVVLAIGLAGLVLIYSYNGRPLQLVDRGLGEVAIFLAWGPLMVLGSHFVQAREFRSPWILAAAWCSGMMTTLVLLINEFADREADLAAGRKTVVTVFGWRGGLRVYLLLALSCYAAVAAGVFFGGWPARALFVFLTLPLPLLAARAAARHLGNWPAFLPAVKATVLMNFLFLVILSLLIMV